MSGPKMSAAALTDISTYLIWNYDRLVARLTDVARQMEDGDLAGAGASFTEYERALARRMRVEEEHLFPLFERKTGKSAASMRREHSPIAQAMDAIRAALAVGDQAAFRRARALLENVLGPHNRKEEASLYRALDKLLTPVEREAFVRKLAGLT